VGAGCWQGRPGAPRSRCHLQRQGNRKWADGRSPCFIIGRLDCKHMREVRGGCIRVQTRGLAGLPHLVLLQRIQQARSVWGAPSSHRSPPWPGTVAAHFRCAVVSIEDRPQHSLRTKRIVENRVEETDIAP